MRGTKLWSVAAIGLAFSLAGCGGSKGDGSEQAALTGTEESKAPTSYGECAAARECRDGKAVVCHVPPGNPANAHEICIGLPAVPAHLENHEGDHLGCCKRPDDKDDYGRPDGDHDGDHDGNHDGDHDYGEPDGDHHDGDHDGDHDCDHDGDHGDCEKDHHCKPECAEARECRLAGKALVCHVPPGNPENAHEICIGWPAVPAHLENHDDFLGCCERHYDLR